MKLLILCAHTDDEVGCAGTALRFIEEGYKVTYVAFSDIQKSLQQEMKHPYAARRECEKSMKVLGIKDFSVMRYPVRMFPEHRQEILENMVRMREQIKPKIVFTHSSSDFHQDHKVIFQETLRAFKYSSIYGYELPQNIIISKNTAYFQLDRKHIEKKIEAISCYESQSKKPFLSREFIESLATIRGIQCDAQFAESFEAIRIIQ